MVILVVYVIVMNLLGFLVMGIDKYKAKKQAWRVPESTLFILAIIGGSLGSIVGMYAFRHKTRHWYFVYGLPFIFVLQIAIGILLLKAINFTIM
ncbi:MAG: DUF1294 domain-containing protein [Clostridiales bacterium]|nr:DUF1294 domain-containing protein [Clostridiales bacterium]